MMKEEVKRNKEEAASVAASNSGDVADQEPEEVSSIYRMLYYIISISIYLLHTLIYTFVLYHLYNLF